MSAWDTFVRAGLAFATGGLSEAAQAAASVANSTPDSDAGSAATSSHAF